MIGKKIPKKHMNDENIEKSLKNECLSYNVLDFLFDIGS